MVQGSGRKPIGQRQRISKHSFVRPVSSLNNRVVFNIAGNKYRLIVWVKYPVRVMLVRFIGSHKEYDAVADPSSI